MEDKQSSPDAPLRFQSSLEVLPIEDNLVLFNPESCRIWVLNAFARRLFEGLSLPRPKEGLAKVLSQSFEVSLEETLAAIEESLCVWRKSGLLLGGGGQSPPEAAKPAPLAGPVYSDMAEARPGLGQEPGPEAAMRRCHFVVENVPFSLELNNPLLFKIISGLYESYRVSNDTQRGPLYSLLSTNLGHRLRRDGQELDFCESLEEACGQLKHAVFAHVMGDWDHGAVIHGAGLCHDEDLYLFPGVSGAGKSTLSARLALAGYGLANDDLLYLRASDLKIFGLPLGIKLREPSWRLIEPLFPALAELPVKKHGSQRVKSLPIPVLPLARLREGFHLKGVVFPNRILAGQGDGQASCARLSATEAFVRLNECNAWFSPKPGNLARIIGLIERTPAYELRYESLEDALRLFEREVLP